MHRRTFVGVAAVGLTGFAGCTGGRSNTGEAQAATPTPEPRARPDSQRGADGQRETDSGADETPEQEFASVQSLPDLTAETVSFSGISDVSEAGLFTAEGGPVIFGYEMSTTPDMVGARFSINVISGAGAGRSSLVDTELSIETEETLRGRVVKWLAPGEYQLSVGAKDFTGRDVEWTITVEQPGLTTTGATLPLAVEGEHKDVVGPVSLTGSTRVTLESLDTYYNTAGYASDSNHIVTITDQRGGNLGVLINELEMGPQAYSDVFDGSTIGVGYIQVTASRVPWRLTVEPV